MRLYINEAEGGRLVRSFDNPEDVREQRVELKRGDTRPLDFLFGVAYGAARELSANLNLKFGVKPLGDYTADFLTSNWDATEGDFEFEKLPGDEHIYRVTPPWNTAEITALFDDEEEFADVMGEVQILEDGVKTSSLTFTIRVFNDVIKDDEGVPPDPVPSFPSPGDMLTKSGNLSGLADVAAARNNIGIGSVAVQDADDIELTGGTITNVSISGLSNPDSADDAAPAGYVDEKISQALDGLTYKTAVLDRVTAPPGSPTVGDRYLVIATATGDFETHENNLAEYDGSTWQFETPENGDTVQVIAEDADYRYAGSAWEKRAGTVAHNTLASRQGGTVTESYHLTQDQHDSIASASSPSAANPVLTASVDRAWRSKINLLLCGY